MSFPRAAAPSRIVRDYWAGNAVTAPSLAEPDASTGEKFYYDDDAGAGILHLRIGVQAGNDWATLFVKP